MAFGLALDANNDIFIVGGTFKRTSDGAYLAQKVRSILNTIQGEVASDPTFGVPYFTDIFVKPVDLGQVASIFKTQILSIEGVNSLLSFEFDYNSNTREYTLDFSVDSTFGEIDINDVTINSTFSGVVDIAPEDIITRYKLISDDDQYVLTTIDEQIMA